MSRAQLCAAACCDFAEKRAPVGGIGHNRRVARLRASFMRDRKKRSRGLSRLVLISRPDRIRFVAPLPLHWSASAALSARCAPLRSAPTWTPLPKLLTTDLNLMKRSKVIDRQAVRCPFLCFGSPIQSVASAE